jgi:hypothetical protein
MDAQKGIVWADRGDNHHWFWLDPASSVVGCLEHQNLGWGSSIKCDIAELIDDKLLSRGHGKLLMGAMVMNFGELSIRLSQPNPR